MVVGIDNFNYGNTYNLRGEVNITEMETFYYCLEGVIPNIVVWINGDNDPYNDANGNKIRYSSFANKNQLMRGVLIKMLDNAGGINDCVKAKEQSNGNGGSDNGGSDNGGSDNGDSDDDEMDTKTKLLIGAGVLGIAIILIS
jgi:hypothetical protein